MSYFGNMLADVIISAFNEKVGKFQSNKETPSALLIEFRTRTSADEEGYRRKELLIYAPMNYVAVLERDTWDVIPRDELEYDEDSDEEYPKKGCKYRKGASEWKTRMYHDSGWRDGIENFLREHEKALTGFSGGSSSWCKVVAVKGLNLPEDF